MKSCKHEKVHFKKIIWDIYYIYDGGYFWDYHGKHMGCTLSKEGGRGILCR